LVSIELGHSTIKQTEAYSKIDLTRIINNFPLLDPKIQERLNQGLPMQPWIPLVASICI
tara:strand:+ start:241 stop:417 length:177 start_codon:yes stop_codon:yes gene_type:complete